MGKSVSHLVSYILTAILLELSLTLSNLNANFNSASLGSLSVLLNHPKKQCERGGTRAGLRRNDPLTGR